MGEARALPRRLATNLNDVAEDGVVALEHRVFFQGAAKRVTIAEERERER